MQMDIEQAIKVTLDVFDLFGEGEATQVPEKLRQMGVFQDQAFMSYLRAFYLAVVRYGLMMEEETRKKKDVSPQDDYLDEYAFKSLLCAGMLTMTFYFPVKSEDMERVKTYVYDPDVASFLFEFVDSIIIREMAGLSSRQQLLDADLGKE